MDEILLWEHTVKSKETRMFFQVWVEKEPSKETCETERKGIMITANIYWAISMSQAVLNMDTNPYNK